MPSAKQLFDKLQVFRVASISQLSALLDTSPQMVRRWVRQAGDVVRVVGGIADRGRPEQWVCLKSYRSSAMKHDWQVTGVAVEVVKASAATPNTAHQFLPATFEGTVPDLCFILRRSSRNCLFFVEVDRGTEPITRSAEGSDLSRKLWRYVELRATNRYLGALTDENLVCHGFRVLLVTDTEKRYEQACRLVKSIPGSFVWVSSWERLLASGMSGAIWQPGGKVAKGASIFGASPASNCMTIS